MTFEHLTQDFQLWYQWLRLVTNSETTRCFFFIGTLAQSGAKSEGTALSTL